jgi:hypothetical protein
VAGLLLGVCLVAGCSSDPVAPEANPTTPAGGSRAGSTQVSPSAPAERSSRPPLPGRTHLLFLGNSHTKRHDVPGTIAVMLRAGRPSVRASVAVAPGLLHLNERATDQATQRLLQSRRWDVVVLQAQNYSLSGITDYPNSGSVALVRSARRSGALPVLLAEWARRGIDETQIILDTYRAIARRQPACLPPIPETFDYVLAQDPGLSLRAEDGNHSSAAGAFLASLVLYATISGDDVAALPDLGISGVPRALQRQLRALAAAELERIPATRGCPE